MGSWAGDVLESPESVYQKATSVLAGSGMKVVTTIPSQSLTAEGGKDVNFIALAVVAMVGFFVLMIGLNIINGLLLAIIGLIVMAVAAVYYFMAPKNTFNVGISALGQGSRISITSSGSKSEGTQSQLIGILRMGGTGTGAARVCKNCRATVTDPAAGFCPSCGSKL
jgi:hypothetical protein